MKTSPRHNGRDSGAVLALVVVLATSLLGVGALVIDIGALYAEKRQLQNGADAAALAVAQDCAQGNCGSSAQYMARAVDAANRNAKDDVSNVEVVCGVGPGLAMCADGTPPGVANALGWVKVRTYTGTPDGGTEVDFLLAPIMGSISSARMWATSVAAYGYAASMRVLPIGMDQCIWQEALQRAGGDIDRLIGADLYVFARLDTKGKRGKSPYPPDYCNSVTPPGGVDSGNFGWIDNNVGCLANVTIGGWVGGDPGNDATPITRNCDVNTDVLGQEVALPLYDAIRGSGGNNVEFRISGFIGFRVLAFHLNGARSPSDFECSNAPDASNVLRCVYGVFTRVLQAGDIGTGGRNTGAVVIQMVG